MNNNNNIEDFFLILEDLFLNDFQNIFNPNIFIYRFEVFSDFHNEMFEINSSEIQIINDLNE